MKMRSLVNFRILVHLNTPTNLNIYLSVHRKQNYIKTNSFDQ